MLLIIYFLKLPLNITAMFLARTAHLTFNMFPDTKGIQFYDFKNFENICSEISRIAQH